MAKEHPAGLHDPTSSPDFIEQVEASLRARFMAQAALAHDRYAPLSFAKIEALLHDPECVRFPTRLVFALGGMAPHQFAQPEADPDDREGNGRILCLRPALHDHPDLIVQAVAYLIPVINYGEIITDEHCLAYGAILLGCAEAEYYEAVCRLADAVNLVGRCCVAAPE